MTDQAKLDAFLLRAGFTYGWRELESQARSMAEQAVEELDTSAERLADLQENADLKDVHWQQVCTAFGFAGHADPEELIAKAAQLTEAEASRQRMMDNAAAFAEALGERREENEALAARLAEAERVLRICANYPPAGMRPQDAKPFFAGFIPAEQRAAREYFAASAAASAEGNYTDEERHVLDSLRATSTVTGATNE